MDQTQSVTTETNRSQIQSTQRRSRTVQQKLEFCEWHITNGLNISKTARHFEISRKQIRFYFRNHQLYLNMEDRRIKRYVSDPCRVRKRGKFPDQEQTVFELFTERRESGNFIF